jgi:peroxiredoxin
VIAPHSIVFNMKDTQVTAPSLTPLFPRQRVPALSVRTIGGPIWTLADQTPERFTLVAFYRGLHCPICGGYLQDLSKKVTEFERRGVTVVAVSSDTEERAEESKRTWRLTDLVLGYGLDIETARRWGLYISRGHRLTSTGLAEPALFSEPALYLVRPDGTLYFGTTQTMPFARPHFGDVLTALDFVIAKDYPARGEVTNTELPQLVEGLEHQPRPVCS